MWEDPRQCGQHLSMDLGPTLNKKAPLLLAVLDCIHVCLPWLLQAAACRVLGHSKERDHTAGTPVDT